MGNSHDLTPGTFIAVQTPFNVGIQAIESFSCRRLESRLTSNASLRASHVACVLLARVVRMMRGLLHWLHASEPSCAVCGSVARYGRGAGNRTASRTLAT